jgi:hypothetical protein
VDAGATQLDGTLTVGVDNTGADVKFFGATTGSYMLWDESADQLLIEGPAEVLNLRDESGTGASAFVYMSFSGSDDARGGYIGLASASNQDMYIASDNGSIKMQSDVSLENSSLTNVGASGNDWTQNDLTLSGGTATQTLTVKCTGTTANAELRLEVPASATSDPKIWFIQGDGSGDANNMKYGMGYDTSAAYFSVRSYDIDGSSTNSDIWRIYDGNADVRAKDDWVDDYFDYVCESCNRHSDKIFTCCGEVEWHDDVLALREMGKDKKVMQRMIDLGVMHRDKETDWLGISFQGAHHFTWSAMHQLYERINTLEKELQEVRSGN